MGVGKEDTEALLRSIDDVLNGTDVKPVDLFVQTFRSEEPVVHIDMHEAVLGASISSLRAAIKANPEDMFKIKDGRTPYELACSLQAKAARTAASTGNSVKRNAELTVAEYYGRVAGILKRHMEDHVVVKRMPQRIRVSA